MLDLGVMLAQAAPVAVQPVGANINLTEIMVTIVSGTFTLLGIVLPIWVSSHIKNKDAATAVNNAIANSLGAVHNAAAQGLERHPLQVHLPGVSATTAAGVQYVLDHVGDEALRAGISPASIADRIEARLGLVSLHADVTAQANAQANAAAAPQTPPLVDPATGQPLYSVPGSTVTLTEGPSKGG